MVKKTAIKLGKTLQQLLRQRGITVEKIVVFGSYARDKEKKDSDIDVIIVSPDFRNKDIFEKVELTSGIHRALVKKTNKPVDIMYYSDIEWSESYSLVINAAKREGEVIYG